MNDLLMTRDFPLLPELRDQAVFKLQIFKIFEPSGKRIKKLDVIYIKIPD